MLLLLFAAKNPALAFQEPSYIGFSNRPGHFPLCSGGQPAVLKISAADYPGVAIAAKNLQNDLKMVTGLLPPLVEDDLQPKKTVVIIGTLGRNADLQRLSEEKKLDVSSIKGKWETYLIQVVAHPFPGVDQALVIAGSDKRGTIFGIYDLSGKIGVSPWNWWADVPVQKHQELYVKPGQYSSGEPAVKYRGIFLNDEAPALSGWSKDKFGGFNHRFYAHVFELILRLRGNYLWPAMWGSAFYDDDPENARTADDYGVVIGTSHHEPLMRAHDEWRRYGNKGAWNYSTNAAALRAFWEQGIRRMGKNESIVTVGMRGDGDEPMSEGSNIALLEKIVRDQRSIIADVTKKDTALTPQVWALYKEVQDYYDKGMRVPDDVTLLLCDDNWGNLRKLPAFQAKPRSGGYGIYYHFDYVGDPRNYKWLNTSPLPRIWEQMNLANSYGAKQLWIVNVGDLKPMEFPISFFLDYAWSPDKYGADQLEEYTARWAAQQFGQTNCRQIASVLSRYGKYAARRKPELLDADTYSLTSYHEFEKIITAYTALKSDAEKLYQAMPRDSRAAFYQLVLHPVLACENLNQLYFAVAKNKLYALQGRASANSWADTARKYFLRDSALTSYYHIMLSGGKWNHMMNQTHIGYTSWQQPAQNRLPKLVQHAVPLKAEMGIAMEGTEKAWSGAQKEAILPAIYPAGNRSTYIELFNKGRNACHFTASTGQSWVKLSSRGGRLTRDLRLTVTADFSKAPPGESFVPIYLNSAGKTHRIQARIINPRGQQKGNGFVEQRGYISMEAAHFSRKISSDTLSWRLLADHGRTGSAITPWPVTASVQHPAAGSPRLEYRICLERPGSFLVKTYLSPTLDFSNTDGLQYAISVDGEKPQLININSGGRSWDKNVSENINIQRSAHSVQVKGIHTLKFWMVSPGVVLQKIVLETEKIPYSYLGPPESLNLK